MDKLLLRMLTAALRRHGCLGPLDDLEQRLLNTFARHIARDGKVLGLTGHLVDLVDVDDADLGSLDIEISCRDELEQDVLDVLADIAGFGKRGGIRDGERNLQRTGEGLGQQRFAGARGPQQHDVRFRKLDIAFLGLLAKADALVMVIHRNGQSPLRGLLPHHMLGQLCIQLVGRRELREHELGARRCILLHMGLYNPVVTGLTHGGHLQTQVAHHGVGAYGDALIADIDAVRARDHGRNLMRMLAAECAHDVLGVLARVLIVVSIVHRDYRSYSDLAIAARDVTIRSTRPYSSACSAVM